MSPVKDPSTMETSPFPTKEFSKMTLVQTTGREIPILARKPDYFDCPPSWSEYLKCGPNIYSMSCKKYIKEWIAVHEKNLNDVVKNNPLEYFAKKTIQATHLADEDPKAACSMLDALAKMAMDLDSENFPDDYKTGLANLIVGTKYEIRNNTGVCAVGQKVKIEPKMLEELSDAAKCPVLAAKIYFCRVAKGSVTYQKSLAETILSYDELRAEWHFLHHRVLRDYRHQDASKFHHRPDGTEVESLRKAVDMDPENPEYQVSVIKTLFDFLRLNPRLYIHLGGKEFKTRDQVEQHLVLTIENAVKEGKEASVRGLLAAAQIIGSFRIPEGMQNLELAEQLLNKALAVWPTNCKTLHRIGCFYMNHKKDMDVAKQRFLEAMTEDPSDAISALHYYWIEAASPENKERCVKEIESKLHSNIAKNWPGHVQLDLMFLKGCINFSRGVEHTPSGMHDWSVAQALEFRYFMSKLYGLNKSLRKFSWKTIKEDGTEGDMYDDSISTLVDAYVASQDLPADEIADSEFGQVSKTLKMVKDARSKPKPERSGVDGDNWRSKNKKGDENENKEEGQQEEDSEKKPRNRQGFSSERRYDQDRGQNSNWRNKKSDEEEGERNDNKDSWKPRQQKPDFGGAKKSSWDDNKKNVKEDKKDDNEGW